MRHVDENMALLCQISSVSGVYLSRESLSAAELRPESLALRDFLLYKSRPCAGCRFEGYSMADPARHSDVPATHVKAYLVMVLGVLGLGFSGIFVRWANAPGAVTGFYRMVVALTVLAPYFVRRLRARGRLPRKELLVALLGGLFFAGDLLLWNTGILLSGATNPTLMGNIAPLWVGIGALIFFRERLERAFWFGLSFAVAGAAIILGLDTVDDVGLGTFFGLLSGIFYGAYYLVMQRSRQHLDSLTAFWLAGASAMIVLLLGALLLRQPVTGYSTFTYLNFVAMGIVVQVGGQLAISYALGYLPASIVSPTNLGQSVLTALLAIPLLGEKLTLWQIVGGIMVIVGVYTVHRSRLAGASKNQRAVSA
jgi:drug/metabolite transporter (DMT)-like permease